MEQLTLRDSLLPFIRCPYCAGNFEFDEKSRPAMGRAEFGLLRCACSTFPVVDGIPIIQRTPVCMLEHTRGTQETEGIEIAALVDLIRRGDTLDALLECVAVPEIPKAWRAAGWRLSHSRLAMRAARWRSKKKFVGRVLEQRDRLGASDVLGYYYLSGGPLAPAMGHYFIRRFGQPRHLAALAMAATIPSQSKPILDIACGIGNLEHYFGCRSDPARAVGLDMNFYHLWIARHWMAPSARYVCANASDGLPFADAAFAATICSDAYHLIRNHEHLLREIERCAPGRTVVLTRVGNGSVMPNEGVERSLQGYLSEFGAVARAFDEDSLVRRYLRRVDAFSVAVQSEDELGESKWLSFAWHVPTTPLRTIAADTIAPHAVGTLGINPIYAQTPGPAGSLQLQFQFPLVWYAYENHAMLSYHPRLAALSRAQLENLSSWRDDPAMQQLVDAFVLLGLPSRFSGDRSRQAKDRFARPSM
jgi:SAM-dependent methyltransferase/uncharacterized protein YbaR (Trm112 family)